MLYSLENNVGVKKTYSIDTRVVKMIGDRCGIKFEDMIKMTPNDLAMKFVENPSKVLKK